MCQTWRIAKSPNSENIRLSFIRLLYKPNSEKITNNNKSRKYSCSLSIPVDGWWDCAFNREHRVNFYWVFVAVKESTAIWKFQRNSQNFKWFLSWIIFTILEISESIEQFAECKYLFQFINVFKLCECVFVWVFLRKLIFVVVWILWLCWRTQGASYSVINMHWSKQHFRNNKVTISD